MTYLIWIKMQTIIDGLCVCQLSMGLLYIINYTFWTLHSYRTANESDPWLFISYWYVRIVQYFEAFEYKDWPWFWWFIHIIALAKTAHHSLSCSSKCYIFELEKSSFYQSKLKKQKNLTLGSCPKGFSFLLSFLSFLFSSSFFRQGLAMLLYLDLTLWMLLTLQIKVAHHSLKYLYHSFFGKQFLFRFFDYHYFVITIIVITGENMLATVGFLYEGRRTTLRIWF